MPLGRTTIVFSGDLGRYGDAMMLDPAPIPAADYLVVESTYGTGFTTRAIRRMLLPRSSTGRSRAAVLSSFPPSPWAAPKRCYIIWSS